MTSFTREIAEGGGGYVLSGYVSSGYVTATTNWTDTASGLLAATRTITPTVTLSDAIKLGIKRVIATQITTIVEAITRRIVATRQLTTGTGGYTSTGYVSSGYLTDDKTTISDSLGRVRDVPRTITQTVTLTDIIKLDITRFIAASTITATHSIGRVYAALRSPSETWVHTNSVARALAATRTLTQTVTITELIVTFKGLAGEGARRIKEATTFLTKRSGITNIFKRSGTTST